jgi:hypothetical protein
MNYNAYTHTVFGIHTPKSLHGFPPGRTRIRMRPREFVKVFVKTEKGIAAFSVMEKDGFWIPRIKIAENISIDRREK